jgi:hypothetical protein
MRTWITGDNGCVGRKPPPLNGERTMPYPAITRTDPADECTDACSDAAKIIAAAMANHQGNGVTCDDECLEEVDGSYVTFLLPSITVRVKRNKYPGLMAQHALEEVALQLLAASREAAVTK